MDDCVFCKIIKNELPSEKVYEDDKVLAFLDIKPINIGHALVITKNHYPNIYETPDAELCAMTVAAKKISLGVREAVKADGINIAMNNGHPAGQLVFHSHLHVIPRFTNDGFEHWGSKRPYQENEMSATATLIRAQIK